MCLQYHDVCKTEMDDHEDEWQRVNNIQMERPVLVPLVVNRVEDLFMENTPVDGHHHGVQSWQHLEHDMVHPQKHRPFLGVFTKELKDEGQLDVNQGQQLCNHGQVRQGTGCAECGTHEEQVFPEDHQHEGPDYLGQLSVL